jgi:hypothetical protein
MTGCHEETQAALAPPQEPVAFTALYAELEALGERDDLDAYDARDRIRYGLKNRSWKSVQTDDENLAIVPEAQRGDEKRHREAWRGEHIAYSWDNLDPDAQLEPKPQGLSLTWLEMAESLPLARNGWLLTEPTVTDYFQRKRWYHPAPDGKRRLSMVDRVQIEQAQKGTLKLDSETLRAHLKSLPLPRMSPGEADREVLLAEKLLSERAP